MPVRSSPSSVKLWPTPDVVLAELRPWAARQRKARSELAALGYFGSHARRDTGFGSGLDLVRPRMNTRTLAVLLPLIAVACQPDSNDGSLPAPATRDSADIRIVENPRPPDGSRLWQVGPEWTLSIGDREGADPYLLHQVVDAMKLPDGRIVVANGGDGELRVFDASGTHVATWGGRGEGPDEFDYLALVEPWPGDSIIAWYGPRLSLKVFDSEGNLGRTFTLEQTVDHPVATVRAAAVIAGGRILAGQHPHVADPVVVEVRDAEGRLFGSLGEHPGDERYIANEGTDRAMMFQPIFGARAVQVPWGDLVVHNLNNRNEVRAFARDGTLARIVRWGRVPRSPTPEEVDAHIEERVSWETGEEDRLRARNEYRSVPVAENLPGFASVVVDRLNHLWIEEYEPPGQERPGSVWAVFDPEGQVLGLVETPDRVEIFEIGEDYILGCEWDALEVERVRVWPLQRG